MNWDERPRITPIFHYLINGSVASFPGQWYGTEGFKLLLLLADNCGLWEMPKLLYNYWACCRQTIHRKKLYFVKGQATGVRAVQVDAHHYLRTW